MITRRPFRELPIAISNDLSFTAPLTAYRATLNPMIGTTCSGIYMLYNICTEWAYVGASYNIEQRRTSHFGKMAIGTHERNSLNADCATYGLDSFLFVALEFCSPADLCAREAFWHNAIYADPGKNSEYSAYPRMPYHHCGVLGKPRLLGKGVAVTIEEAEEYARYLDKSIAIQVALDQNSEVARRRRALILAWLEIKRSPMDEQEKISEVMRLLGSRTSSAKKRSSAENGKTSGEKTRGRPLSEETKQRMRDAQSKRRAAEKDKTNNSNSPLTSTNG